MIFSITGGQPLGADSPGIIIVDDPLANGKLPTKKSFEELKKYFPDRLFAADDSATHPTGPTKPYNEAVNDVHRYLKEVVEKAPDTQIDGSVKEGVVKDLDDAIGKRNSQKTWPGALR